MTDYVWFELPVKNLERAVKFYKALLVDNTTIKILKGNKCAMLLNSEGTSYGCLYEENSFIPDMFGIIIYFGIFSDIKEKVHEIIKLGGKVLSYKKRINSFGFNALIQDSEGNRIAIYKQDETIHFESNKQEIHTLTA